MFPCVAHGKFNHYVITSTSLSEMWSVLCKVYVACVKKQKIKILWAIYYRKSGLTFCFGVILKKAIGWIYFEKFSYFDTLVYFEMITIKFRTALIVYTLFRSSQKF